MEQVDLVDDEEADELRVGALPRLARDDVPLFGGGHDDLRLVDLGLGEVDVARELLGDDPVGLEALREVPDHLGNKGLHGCHVDDLEGRGVDGAVVPEVHPDLVEDAQHGAVGLSGARGGAQQHVLAGEHRGLVDLTGGEANAGAEGNKVWGSQRGTGAKGRGQRREEGSGVGERQDEARVSEQG